ncbi:MAG: VOC family protein [Paracoccaceae bacterium]|nr:VOC family protein [Paracoccaceae bacterium]
MTITGVNHITLVVADLPRAVGFYTSVLGAEQRTESDRSVYLELGALWLCLEKGTPAPAQDDSHIAFSCSEAAFAELTSRLSEAAPLWKTNTSEGASLYFCDPDGHKLELHVGELPSRLAHYAAHPDKGVRVL